MAFVKDWKPKIGDKVKTTKKIEIFGGYLEQGSIVTIIGESNRGYDIIDDEGNEFIECGWDFFRKPKDEELIYENFNPKAEIEILTAWIRDWFDKNGSKANAVIGISGGKDSTIIAALLVRALGKDRVVGVMMPNGVQKDIEDAQKVVDFLGIKSFVVNINDAYNGLLGAINGIDISKDTIINLPPRLRMATLYAIAQSMPNGGRVINTCNKSEDYVGYSTKYGDAAGDVSPCSDYLVCEMLQIGDALELPYDLVHKTPSDGLCGQTDEDKLGFTYDELDTYIKTGILEDKEKKEKIDRMHMMNLHKLQTIPMYKR